MGGGASDGEGDREACGSADVAEGAARFPAVGTASGLVVVAGNAGVKHALESPLQLQVCNIPIPPPAPSMCNPPLSLNLTLC